MSCIIKSCCGLICDSTQCNIFKFYNQYTIPPSSLGLQRIRYEITEREFLFTCGIVRLKALVILGAGGQVRASQLIEYISSDINIAWESLFLTNSNGLTHTLLRRKYRMPLVNVLFFNNQVMQIFFRNEYQNTKKYRNECLCLMQQYDFLIKKNVRYIFCISYINTVWLSRVDLSSKISHI